MTDANRNFSKVAKATESNGAVVIEKNGIDRFFVMTADEYKRLAGEIIWVEMNENTFVKYEILKDIVTAQEIERIGKDKYKYTICKMPAGSMQIEFDGDNVAMEFNKNLLKAISTRDALTLFRSVEVDISKKSISDLAKDKASRDTLVDAITVKDLVEEQILRKIEDHSSGKVALRLSES